MISIKSLSKVNQQNFHVFSEESWYHNADNFSRLNKFFNGKKYEFFVRVENDKVDFLIGVGKENELTPALFLEIAQKFSNEFKEKFEATPTSIFGELDENHFSNFVEGLFLGTYSYPFDKLHPFWHKDFEIHYKEIDEKQAEIIAEKTEALCYGQFAGMEWMNKPANFKTAKLLSFFLGEEAHKLKIKYKALNRIDCKKEGLGAYLAVNKASSQDAAFTIMEYDCGNPNAKTIGLVGKCVLFDTGGISIKESHNMHYMKSDIGGAATVIGVLLTIAKLKIPVNLITILPITDNVVSNEAYLPSDVVTACNGKTIEVLNTDAEGRMTLADGLAYISKYYKTDVLIDLATLTGSAVRMFGNICAPYFSNNPELRMKLEESAERTGQLIWNMPLWEVWKNDIKSDVADLKNTSLKPYGDCIVAAKFLEQFTNEHPNWAHFDIAGVAFDKVNYSKEKAATGYGVRLLVDFILNYKMK